MDFDKLLAELKQAETMIGHHRMKGNEVKAYFWKQRAAVTIADVKKAISLM